MSPNGGANSQGVSHPLPTRCLLSPELRRPISPLGNRCGQDRQAGSEAGTVGAPGVKGWNRPGRSPHRHEHPVCSGPAPEPSAHPSLLSSRPGPLPGAGAGAGQGQLSAGRDNSWPPAQCHRHRGGAEGQACRPPNPICVAQLLRGSRVSDMSGRTLSHMHGDSLGDQECCVMQARPGFCSILGKPHPFSSSPSSCHFPAS